MLKSSLPRLFKFAGTLTFSLLVCAGCQNQVDDTALLGTAFGAATGALVGHGRGEAIAIGAGLGAISGSVIGQGREASRRKEMVRSPMLTSSAPLTLEQIVQLCRAGTAPAEIIRIMRARGGVYNRADITVLAAYPEVPASVTDYLRSGLPGS